MLSSRYTVTVGWGDCDPAGIVYNPNYFDWFDRSVHALLAKAGFSLRAILRDFGIDGLPLVETKVTFSAPCFYGDEIVVVTEVVKLHRSAFELHHRVLKGDKLVVEGFETRVCTAFDPAAGRVKAQQLPAGLAQALAAEP